MGQKWLKPPPKRYLIFLFLYGHGPKGRTERGVKKNSFKKITKEKTKKKDVVRLLLV